MMRNVMFAIGLFTMTAASAMAAPVPTRPHHRVAQAQETAPANSGARKAKTHKGKVVKKAAPAPAKQPAPTPTPVPAPTK